MRMNEAKFTKGEWTVSGCGLSVNAGGFKVARAHSGGNTPYTTTTIANAHLIAAAPKMYKFLDDLANGRGVDYPIEQLLKEVRGE
ncbi:hypothetical protein [Pseudoalteromonas phage H103]|uniref:hypothetical protein n=1 Tax=Pseudoalteromonas phage H103 TaxID=1636200 RepID=UPI0006BDF86E|nr:hypothetical protein AVU31_gp31 [Pseudoalteromonas phage H103]AKA61207.1 hypothetical protein [Pseudoalteromonas phage H103]